MNRWKPQYLWIVIVAFVVLLTVWWLPGPGRLLTDSYSVNHGGKKIFYRMLEELDTGVSRQSSQLIPPTPEPATLLILGPARNPTPGEWEDLYDEVLTGSTLIFAAKLSDPIVDLGPFGVSISLDEFSSSFDTDLDFDPDEIDEQPIEFDFEEEAEDESESEEFAFPEFDHRNTAETPLLNSSTRWTGRGVFEFPDHSSFPDSRWETLLSVQGEPQVIRARIGAGTVIAMTSDEVFSNRSMLDDNRALLAFRIIESAPGTSRIFIDESLNSSGGPKAFGILFDPLFRLVTLQLILIAVLFGWSGSIRLGAIRQLRTERRRSIVEHAEALGNLYFRTGNGGRAVESAFEALKADLRSQFGMGARQIDPELLARRAQMEPSEVKEILASVTSVAGQEKVSAAVASRVLSRLAVLRSRMNDRE